jgi:hypothetical protein
LIRALSLMVRIVAGSRAALPSTEVAVTNTGKSK